MPPLCRETQSLGQQMLNATVGINGLMPLIRARCDAGIRRPLGQLYAFQEKTTKKPAESLRKFFEPLYLIGYISAAQLSLSASKVKAEIKKQKKTCFNYMLRSWKIDTFIKVFFFYKNRLRAVVGRGFF